MLNTGGNPLMDSKESVERFKTIVHPVLTNQGFKKLKGSGHIMYNEEKNVLVIVKSCPSQVAMYGDTKNTIKKMSGRYGKVKIYIFYSRDFSEWGSKETYISTLRRIITIGRVDGIAIGVNNLTKLVSKINRNEKFIIGME